MIRLIAPPFIAVLLMGALPAFDAKTITQYESLITGNPPVQFVALEQESNAGEEEVVVEVVPEPEPPKCGIEGNRGWWVNTCTGERWEMQP